MRRFLVLFVLVATALATGCTATRPAPRPAAVPTPAVVEIPVTVEVEKVVEKEVEVEKVITVEVTRVVTVPVEVEVVVTATLEPADTPPAAIAATEPITGGIPGPADTTACVNKLWTYPENSERREYYFEVQSSVLQHTELYRYGTQTVSVLEVSITPQERSDYAIGLGSAFAYYLERPGCEKLDPMADMASYARARLDQGHSGLVFDNREGEMELIVNLRDLSDAEIEGLLQMYLTARAQAGSPVSVSVALAPMGAPITTTAVTTDTTTTTVPVATACGAAQRGKDFATAQVGPFDDVVVATPWGGTLSEQIAVVLEVGQSKDFGQEGGALWVYSGCTPEQATQDAVDNSGLEVFVLNGKDEMLAWATAE